MLEHIKKIDKELLLFINSHHNSFLDFVIWFSSGTSAWFPLYAFVIILLIQKFKDRSWLLILLVAPLIIISDQLTSEIIISLTHRFRPSHEPGLENLLHYINHYRGDLYSFPSPHACNFFSWVTYLSLTAGKKIKWLPCLLIPVALLVCYSRVYLGVHYPTDVFCGAILGSFLGWVVSKIYYGFDSLSGETLIVEHYYRGL